MNEITLIQIEPTTRCNFTCSFCSGRHLEQRDLELTTYEKLLTQVKGVAYIELQGEGEPFLHPGIYEMIRCAKKKEIQVCTITNGSLLTSANVENILDSGLDSLNISLETPVPEEFHRIRGGDLDKIIEGIKRLVQRKKERQQDTPIIGFAVTVLRSTASKLKDIFELYKSLEMDGGIALQFLNQSQEYSKYYTEAETGEYLTLKEQRLIRRNYFRWMNEITVNQKKEHFFTRMEREMKQNGGKAGYCVWLENGLYVNCQGYASSCVYSKDSTYFSLGHVEQDGFPKIYAERKTERDKIRNCEVTKNCNYVNCDVVKKIKEMKSKE